MSVGSQTSVSCHSRQHIAAATDRFDQLGADLPAQPPDNDFDGIGSDLGIAFS